MQPTRPVCDTTDPVTQLKYACGPILEALGRFGLGLDGVMHVLLGALALQIAWEDRPADPADQSGAMSKVDQVPAGNALLWFFVVGFAGLAAMQFAISVNRHRHAHSRDPLDRSLAAPIGVWYLGLAVLAGSYAVGRGAGKARYDVTADVFAWPGGRYLVGTIGVGVVVVGLYHAYKGWWQQHRHDIHHEDRTGASGEALVRLGQFGYLAKAVALTVTGVLVVLAAVQYDPADATGLDHGLRSFTEHPAGPAMLTVVGIGIVAFGIYLLAITRRGKL